MFVRIAKVVLIAALLSAIAAGAAPAFSPRGDHDFCDFTTLEPTNCFTRADGSCYTKNCADPTFNCSYAECSHGFK
jgi:hypothetical protein